jgi:hypothetical protein
VFDVGGIIPLTKSLDVTTPYVTVAGQTAPSPGITITGAPLQILAHDVLVQHLRFRIGDSPDGPDPDARDGVSVYDGGNPAEPTERVVIDHCSVSWATDEGTSTWGMSVSDVTFSNCIIAENLSHSIHPKGEHSKGLLIGDHTKRFCVMRCLFAHNLQRNPIVKGDVSALVVDNIIYNPGYVAHMDDPEDSGPSCARFENNLLIPGADTPWWQPFMLSLWDVKAGSSLNFSGNITAGHVRCFKYKPWTELVIGFRKEAAPMVDVRPLTLLAANDLKAKLLPVVGARPTERDAVDIRIINDVVNGTGRVIDSPKEVGGLSPVTETRREFVVPTDPDKDADGDGYTNLEAALFKASNEVEGEK